MHSFERLPLLRLLRLKLTMRSLVTAELVEGHRRSRRVYDHFAPDRTQHFRLLHDRTIEVDLVPAADRQTCCVRRIGIRDFEAVHRPADYFFHLLGRNAEIDEP